MVISHVSVVTAFFYKCNTNSKHELNRS